MVSARKVSEFFDIVPGDHHKYNYELSKPFIKNKKVLDVGCWSGQFERLATKDTKQISAIDPDKEAIVFAKKQMPELNFKVGDAHKIPFNDKQFDTVVFLEVLEHVPKNSEREAISEIGRVLKAEGYLILSTPNHHPVSILLDPAFFLIGHRHYKEVDLRNLLTSNNFQIIKILYSGGLAKMLTDDLNLVAKRLLGKPINYPNFIKNAIKREYLGRGFGTIHIIAQKIKE